MDDDDDEYDFNGEVASEVEGDADGSCVGLSTEPKDNQHKPCKPSSVSRSASKMSKKQKRSIFPESVGFNAMLMAIAQEKKAALESNARYHKDNGKVDKVVDLMEKWERACKAMGSRIKATYACSEFEQFLERQEKKNLRCTERSKMHHR